MIDHPPPEDGRGAQGHPTPDASDTLSKPPPTTTPDTVARQLRRRRAAASRLPGGDPWTAGHDRWRDQHDVAAARSGQAPRWQLDRARRVWAEAGR